MKHLQSRGQDLRLLSLHGLNTDCLLQDKDLESIVRLCPNLQQLAIQVAEESLTIPEWCANLGRIVVSRVTNPPSSCATC
jgi:hypothetical protein